MKTEYIFPAILVFAIGWLSLFENLPALAKDETPSKESDSQIIIYKPPMRGAPSNRIGGGTRSLIMELKDELPLKVLVPDHTGLTIHSQPILYWYISSDLLLKQIIFTLNDEDNGATLFQTSLGKIEKDGIHYLDISDYKLKLALNKDYSWSVTIVTDQDNPSLDISSIGKIRRIAPSAVLSERLAKAEAKDIPVIYAQEGIWYDALSYLSQLIELNPGKSYFQKQRATLLEQIGLYRITESDQK